MKNTAAKSAKVKKESERPQPIKVHNKWERERATKSEWDKMNWRERIISDLLNPRKTDQSAVRRSAIKKPIPKKPQSTDLKSELIDEEKLLPRLAAKSKTKNSKSVDPKQAIQASNRLSSIPIAKKSSQAASKQGSKRPAPMSRKTVKSMTPSPKRVSKQQTRRQTGSQKGSDILEKVVWIPNYGLLHSDLASKSLVVTSVSRVDQFRTMVNIFDVEKREPYSRLFCPANNTYSKLSIERVSELKKLGCSLAVLEGTRIKIYKNEKFYKELYEPIRLMNGCENLVVNDEADTLYYKHSDGVQIVQVDMKEDFSIKLLQTGGAAPINNFCHWRGSLFILRHSGFVEVLDLEAKTVRGSRCVQNSQSPNTHPKIGFVSSIVQHIGRGMFCVRQYNGKDRNMDIHLFCGTTLTHLHRFEKDREKHQVMELFLDTNATLCRLFGDAQAIAIERVTEKGSEKVEELRLDEKLAGSGIRLRAANIEGVVYLFEDRIHFPEPSPAKQPAAAGLKPPNHQEKSSVNPSNCRLI